MTPLAAFLAILTLFLLVNCKLLVNKLTFFPDTQNVIEASALPENVTEKFIMTDDEERLQTYLLKSSSNRLLIYFHGNAGNISGRLPTLQQLNRLGLNVLGVSYRGYGKSSGKPCEKGIYLDAKAAFSYAMDSLKFTENRIILLGRSLGTTAAVNLAQDRNIAGLILVTPLTGGKEYGKFHGFGLFSSIAGSAFRNIDKISKVKCPVLVIHGTNDAVIPYAMGKEVYAEIKTEKNMITITGAGHNDIDGYGQYWTAIDKFVSTF